MTGLTFDDPCVLFALRRESFAFRREFRPHQRFPGAPCWSRFCGPAWLSVLLLETGMGPESMERALTWLLSSPMLENIPYRPKVIVSAGYSGSLSDDHKVGDIILATEVADGQNHRWPTTWPEKLPPGEWRPPLHRGRLLSTSTFVSGPEEKRKLGQQHEAIAVDMETSVIARMCSERSVPFGCLRVISDDLRTPLSPKLATVIRGSRVSPWRALMAVVASPGLIGEMRRLAKQTRLASEQLGTALGELLTLTLPWGKEL